jgi:hypothetical protein
MYQDSRPVNSARQTLRRLFHQLGGITMNKNFFCTALVLALPVAAAAAAPKFDQAAMEKARSAAQAQTALAAANAKKLGTTGTAPGGSATEITVNPLRSYPTGCLESPLAYGLWANNPEAVQGNITLFGDPLSPDSGEVNYLETDTITVFRVPCADGLSATLLEIDRPSGMDGNTSRYPTLPGVTVTQGATQDFAIRFSDDVNTFFANNYANSPFYVSNVYVLENYYSNSAPQLNYNGAFTLTINNFASASNLFDFNMSAYHTSDYAAASQPLPINGHLSANWANAAQSGEGIILQVYDQGNSATRVLSFAWFTYDDDGFPMWIYGDAAFNIGARSVTVPTLFFSGGSFGGSLASGVPFAAWGNVTFAFPDCTHMNVSYNGDAPPPLNSGHKQGVKTFERAGYINGVVCI